jgi:4-hydroxymandelate oxidase
MSDRRRCWFQLYIHRDRGLTRTLVQRAEAAGCGALCLTVDTPLAGGRERDRRNHFRLPDHLTLGNFSAEHSELHRMAGDGSSVTAYVGQQLDPALTWSDVEWLRSITQLPVLVKGVLHPDDARLAVDHGATGVIVSNHGGRQLDGTPSSIERLPAIVEAVAPETEVLLDGGVRTGSDVLKAIALGARAVLVGRPILWGLAVAGQDGVARVLAQLRDELADAMRVTGCALLDDIGPHVLRPAVDGNSRIHP